MSSLKLGSFCTGIGGLDEAACEVFDATPMWFCEYDPAPSKVLAHRYPHVPNHGDLTTTDWSQVEPVGIVTAGYPCQPFSQAGQRKGTNDERHLWPSIRDAIRHLRPRYVCLENVRGHLTLGFDQVLGDLADLGFDAEWGVFRSSDIGAPHRRERLFVVAYTRDAAEHGQRSRTISGRRGTRSAGYPNHIGLERARGAWARGNGFADTDITAPDPDRYPAGRDTGAASGTETRGENEPHRPDRHRSTNGSTTTTGRWGRYTGAVRRWETIFGRPAPEPVVNGKQLNPRLPEWMMGYPDGWVTDPQIGLSRAQQLKALGNSVQPQTGVLALSTLAARINRRLEVAA